VQRGVCWAHTGKIQNRTVPEEGVLAQTGSRADTRDVCWEAEVCGLAGDYGIKDRTDRDGKVELISKTGRWAM
jgi:hypothetical protein